MPRRTNMTQCECDRCGEKDLLTEDSPNAADWHDIERVTAEGKPRRFLLCGKCFAKYKDLLNQEDTQYRKFMGEQVS